MIKKILIVCFLLVVCDLLGTWMWLKQSESITAKSSRREPADAAVVLMGDFNHDASGLGRETLRRLHYTVGLYRQGDFAHVICAGGSRPTAGLIGSEYMKEELIRLGLPPDRIIAETSSYDTKSNWKESLKIIQANNWSSVALVSSPIHLFRFQAVILSTENPALNVNLRPYPYDVTLPKATARELWGQVHYEWISFAIHYAMPKRIYYALTRQLRRQN